MGRFSSGILPSASQIFSRRLCKFPAPASRRLGSQLKTSLGVRDTCWYTELVHKPAKMALSGSHRHIRIKKLSVLECGGSNPPLATKWPFAIQRLRIAPWLGMRPCPVTQVRSNACAVHILNPNECKSLRSVENQFYTWRCPLWCLNQDHLPSLKVT